MAKRILAYVLSSFSAPLTLAVLHVMVLAVLGPHHFFHQGGFWDWANFAANELSLVVFSGILPALVFFAPAAWLISRRAMKLKQASIAGALSGLAFCLYAAVNGDWPFMYGLPSWAEARLPLFYFFGSYYGDVLAHAVTGYRSPGVFGLLHVLPPVIAGMLTAGFFQTLIKPDGERG